LCCALQVTRSGVVLQLRQPVRRGCGVVFDAGDPQREEQGGSVFGVVEAGGRALEAADAGGEGPGGGVMAGAAMEAQAVLLMSCVP
jgi:putative protease